MYRKLTSIVNAFAGKRVLLIGDLILDRYAYGDAERISPEAPVPVLRAVETSERVGGSANVAACLRALGVDVLCFGAVGRDAAGDRLRTLMEESGVDCGGFVVAEDRCTSTKTRFVGLAQHRHRQQLLRFDEEYVHPLPDAASQTLLQRIREAMAESDVVCIEDYAKGVVTKTVVEKVVEAARSMGKPVLVDPARLPGFGKYRGANLITPNRSELETAAGEMFPTPESVMECAGELAERWGVESLAVTLDRDGAVWATAGDDPIHLSTKPRSVYDNTGAGDAVLSCLAAAIAAGADGPDAVRLANMAGGLEVEKFGCVPIRVDELLAELRIEHHRRTGKLRSSDELSAELSLRRDRGETVAFTNGVFDLLHPGHMDILAKARDEASLLVVAINSDASAKAQNKAPDRPINDQQFRVRMLEAIEHVDYVVLFDEPTPIKLIERLRPDVLVKGEDWAVKGIVGAELVESYGGRVRMVSLVGDYSTTSIVARIRGEDGA